MIQRAQDGGEDTAQSNKDSKFKGFGESARRMVLK